MAGLAQSLVVEGTGSRMDARNPGFDTRFGPEDLKAIPTRRSSMFDFIRATPGISPTSPGSGTTTTGTTTTASAFGSGTNENQFLLDGTNFTCPCNGVARSEPGVDFIQEIQIQSIGASAEYGNVQGAVVNVVLRPVRSTDQSRISCRDRGAARLRDAGNQRVTQVRAAAGPLAVGGELSRRPRGHRIEHQHPIRKVFGEQAVEPAFQPSPASALRQQCRVGLLHP